MRNALYQETVRRLIDAGCPDADFDAAQLYRFVTGQDPRLGDAATPEQAARLAELTARRAGREPLQYILGEWDFLDLTLKVGPGVLCPRADSEVVCEAAAALLQGQAAPVVLDLCAGTGCLGLGLARLCPGAQVACVEKSPAAYEYLAANTKNTNVRAVLADAFAYCAGLERESVDLIISNPPYLTKAEMDALMPETAREPAMALDGGVDGLDFYRALIGELPSILRPGGWLVLEIGCEQREAVLKLAAAEPRWKERASKRDLGGNDRVILLKKG